MAINQDINELRQVQEALRESEQRYRLMAENSTDLISRHAPSGEYLYASPACRRLLGWEPEELIGHSVYELFHPEDAAALQQTLLAVGCLPENYTLSYRHRKQDGSYIWFETTYRKLRDSQQQEVQEIIAVSRDISDRKLAEAEICALNEELEQRVLARTAELQRANEELKREIAERRRAEEQIKFQVNVLSQVNDAVFAIDSNRRIIYWNGGAERLYNCSSEEAIGRHLEEIYQYRWLNPEDESAAWSTLAETGAWHGEVIHVKKNGEEIYVDMSVSLLKDESGKQSGFLAISRDISEKKHSKEAIARLSHQNELILNSAGEGICGLDCQGKITFANPAAAKMLHCEVEHLIGTSLYDTIARDFQAQTLICGALQDGSAQFAKQDEFWRRDGSCFPVEYACTPIREGGETVGAVITFRDISDRLALEQIKQEFISTVSHELRTPLTSMRGALGLLASGILANQPEKAKHMLEIAVANTDRLARLINDILDLDRLQSRNLALNKHACNAGDLMVQAADTMQAMAQKAGLTIRTEPVNVPLWADSDRLLQTLTNLLSNALKFSPPGSTVWLSAEVWEKQAIAESEPVSHSPDRELLVTVRDRGRGIPPDKLETIFERFQQVDASDARTFGGSGLGLAICRSIVEQHGGRIWVESKLGEGSCFYFTLPLS